MSLRHHQILILFTLGLSILAAAGFILVRSRPDARLSLSETLVKVSRDAARSYIREDLRTSFSDAAETNIETLPGDKYRVSGWVDAISASGEIARQSYSCVIYRTPNGDWDAEDVAIVPQ